MKSSQARYQSVGILALLLGVVLVAGCASDGLRVDPLGDGLVPRSSDLAEPGLSAVRDLAGEVGEADMLRRALGIEEILRPDLDHGPKPAEAQRYIVLHDTEGDGSPREVVDYWVRQGSGVGAHFVVGRDGTIVQCVPLDRIAHHAGFGDSGHNVSFGVNDESRDDKRGTEAIGSWAPDYGMNSYSIGIELVHQGNGDGYPLAQLEALDGLIAYLDAFYGFECAIIDHKAWRSGNSDTSPEFAGYLVNYQRARTHDGRERASKESASEEPSDTMAMVQRSKRKSTGVFGSG